MKLFELPSQLETYLLGLAVVVDLYSLIGHANINRLVDFVGGRNLGLLGKSGDYVVY